MTQSAYTQQLSRHLNINRPQHRRLPSKTRNIELALDIPADQETLGRAEIARAHAAEVDDNLLHHHTRRQAPDAQGVRALLRHVPPRRRVVAWVVAPDGVADGVAPGWREVGAHAVADETDRGRGCDGSVLGKHGHGKVEGVPIREVVLARAEVQRHVDVGGVGEEVQVVLERRARLGRDWVGVLRPQGHAAIGPAVVLERVISDVGTAVGIRVAQRIVDPLVVGTLNGNVLVGLNETSGEVGWDTAQVDWELYIRRTIPSCKAAVAASGSKVDVADSVVDNLWRRSPVYRHKYTRIRAIIRSNCATVLRELHPRLVCFCFPVTGCSASGKDIEPPRRDAIWVEWRQGQVFPRIGVIFIVARDAGVQSFYCNANRSRDCRDGGLDKGQGRGNVSHGLLPISIVPKMCLYINLSAYALV